MTFLFHSSAIQGNEYDELERNTFLLYSSSQSLSWGLHIDSSWFLVNWAVYGFGYMAWQQQLKWRYFSRAVMRIAQNGIAKASSKEVHIVVMHIFWGSRILSCCCTTCECAILDIWVVVFASVHIGSRIAHSHVVQQQDRILEPLFGSTNNYFWCFGGQIWCQKFLGIFSTAFSFHWASNWIWVFGVTGSWIKCIQEIICNEGA